MRGHRRPATRPAPPAGRRWSTIKQVTQVEALERELLELWDDAVGALTEGLLGSGDEAAVLKPLAEYPPAALAVVRHIADWDNHRQRKLAATTVGLLAPSAPLPLLRKLFDAEVSRDHAAATVRPTLFRKQAARTAGYERLLTQSVVEDIVFAAARWCRHPHSRDSGLTILRTVVERAISGEYWNTASYALISLAYHHADGLDTLIDRFAQFTTGPAPQHRTLTAST